MKSTLGLTEITVPVVDDFTLTGDGTADAWLAAPWCELTRVAGDAPYRTRCKQVRSATGIYLLVDAEDRRIDCTLLEDNVELYTEDVVEWFLQPDARIPLYIEYEISPLGQHLVLLVPNHGNGFHGWTGWKLDGHRTIRRAVHVRGGERRPGASVSGWSTECFLPWGVFLGLENAPPAEGGTWRGNVYRIDKAGGGSTQWAWCPDTGSDFHLVDGFGTLRF